MIILVIILFLRLIVSVLSGCMFVWWRLCVWNLSILMRFGLLSMGLVFGGYMRVVMLFVMVVVILDVSVVLCL